MPRRSSLSASYRRTPRPGRGGNWLLGTAIASALLAACSSGVAVAPPDDVTDAERTACTALVAALPDTVDGQARRAVDPDSGLTAAWGTPAIVLRCGSEPPAGLSTECVAVNQVDWELQQREDGYVFHSFGRSPVVEVVVPSVYAPEVNALVALAPAVSALPRERGCG